MIVSSAANLLASLCALVVMPFLLSGVINRVKALWAGRKGPPILQLAYDVWRLLRKTAVYSHTTTPLFRIAPYVALVTGLAAAAITPLLGMRPLASFAFDFVWLAYVWALGRVALMLAALDTGSSFEGMGAAREATFSALLEPTLFLVVGALCALTHTHSLYGALQLTLQDGASTLAWACALAALLIVVQVEASRMPIDDPTTHLELTMVHEVMVLDHSATELAAIQAAAALKLYVGIAMLSTLLNPWSSQAAGQVTLLVPLASVCISLGLAVVIGTIESLIARLRLRTVPQYIVVAIGSGLLALMATVWRNGGAP
jgi:formate hydrogenlyase subunit 4